MPNDSETTKANLRSSIYAVLALAFSTPKDQSQIEKLHAAILEAKEDLGLVEVTDSKNVSQLPTSSSNLSREHLRLFVGPGRVKCPPYESAVRKDRPKPERGLVMGPSTADVRKRYAAAGVAVSKNYKDLPDHVAAEMEFMHFLCFEESKFRSQGNQEQAERYCGMERDFIQDHLAPWVTDFADCVLATTNSPFYKDAANLLKEFAKSEVGYISEGSTE